MDNTLWHTLFWNSDGQRLRPLWRLLLQMAMLGGLLFVTALPFALISYLAHLKPAPIWMLIISTLMMCVAVVGSVAIARRWLDRRSFASLGFANPYTQTEWQPVDLLIKEVFRDAEGNYWPLLMGFLLALLMLGGGYVTMQRLGWLQISGPFPMVDWQALLFLVIFSVVGFEEELLFRGYVLQTLCSYHQQTLSRGWNIFFGMIGSSAIFAAFHLGNAAINWTNILGIFAMGLLLAFAAVRTGRLWLSIGLHTGWNFFLMLLFGSPIPGVTVYSLLHIHVTGPALWAGTDSSTGLIFLPVLLVGAGLVWAFTQGVKR
jgi:membrane protease YdiL (CAAX protease family)